MILISAFAPLSLIYADPIRYQNNNFTYEEILGNRLSQPLPGNYQSMPSDSNPAFSYFVKKYTEKNQVLRFLLFDDDTMSRSIYQYVTKNLSGNIVLMNFGGYAYVNVNMKSAIMNSEYIKFSIPFGQWKDIIKNKTEPK